MRIRPVEAKENKSTKGRREAVQQARGLLLRRCRRRGALRLQGRLRSRVARLLGLRRGGVVRRGEVQRAELLVRAGAGLEGRLARREGQLDLPEANFTELLFLSSLELLMRRTIQIEMAVSRNSKAPSFTGLSVMLSSVTDGSGAIQTKGFHKWVAEKSEARARLVKSERRYHEERATAKKKRKGETIVNKGKSGNLGPNPISLPAHKPQSQSPRSRLR